MPARRRWSERLLLVVNLTVANCVCGLWVATFLRPSVLGADLGPASEALTGGERAMLLPLHTFPAWLAFLSAVALLLWNFAWLVRRGERRPPSNWLVSETSAGPVRVAREAIETGLRLVGERLPEVSRMRVQVDLTTPKRVLIAGQFHCVEGRDHLEVSQRLRQALRDRFAELVRLGDGFRTELQLEFHGFFGRPGKNSPEPAPPAPADTAPFRGPQYPIDDADEDEQT